MNVIQINEEAVFDIARRIKEPDLRKDYVDQACASDPSLKMRIAELLDLHDREESFLESPPAGLPMTLGSPQVTEKLGDLIGPYKLLEQIGEGGMGVVYMAEQKEPIRRKVALKVIKPGMDTKQVVARFEAERQALALMDHPNIAKVHDAGATESGRPYFVMELVKGIPITEHCDQQRLSTSQRLEPFIAVCRAVHHAHQKGIIHRDLKPSNVLVEQHDVTAVPKVIDFGVAKAINQELTERSLFTNFAQMVGTPLYMSPEQAELRGLDVDTRSDIYSLGVLLYEILCGTTPFDSQSLREASFDEIRQIIREHEPPKPSDRISTLNAEASSTIFDRRGQDARKLTRVIRGDLDWIVMKALEKDRTRRYESASAFAADVQRYLRNEPVEATPPSLKYRLSKLVRRHRTALAMAAVLSICTATSVWLAWTATASRQEAKIHFGLARNAVDQLMTRIADEQLLNAPQMEGLRTLILTDALKFYQQMAKIRTKDPDLRLQVALAEDRLGSIYLQLGDREAAQAAQKNAVTQLQPLSQQFPERPEYTIALADALLHHAESLWAKAFLGGFDDNRQWSETACRQAIDLLESLVEESPDRVDYKLKLVNTLLLLVHHFDSDEGVAFRMTSLVAEIIHSDSTNVDYRFAHAQTLDANARTTDLPTDLHRKRFDESLKILEELVREHRDVAKYREWLADVLWNKLNAFPPKQRDHLVQESQRVLKLYEQLALQFPRTPKYQSALSGAQAMYAMALLDVLGDTPDKEQLHAVEDHIRNAARILEDLLKVNPGFEDYQINLNNVYFNLGIVYNLADNHEAVLATDYKILKLAETQLQNYEGDSESDRAVEVRHFVAYARFQVAVALARLGNSGEAIKYADRAHREFDLITEQMSYQAKLEFTPEFAGYCAYFSEQLFADGHVDESCDYAQKALDVYRATVVGHRQDDGREINSVYERLAYLLVTSPHEELRNLPEALEILAPIATRRNADGALKSKEDWVFSMRTRGLAHFRARNWSNAIEDISECVESRDNDDSPGGAAIECFILAMANWQLETHGKAREWLTKAEHWKHKTTYRNSSRNFKYELARLASEANDLIGPLEE